MEKEPRNLDLFGYRDFTLATAQIGTEAESLGLYLGDFKLARPYFVVERRDGKSGYFIDTAQVNRQKEIILEKIAADKSFVDTLIDTSAGYYDELESLLNAGRPLSQAEFAKLVELFIRAWSWMAGWWWATEALEEEGRHPDLVEKIMLFRKKTEKIIPQIDHLTRVTAKTLYPEIAGYADALTLEEISSGEIPPESELRERMHHHLVVNNKVFTGEEIRGILSDMGIILTVPEVTHFKAADGTLTGQIAYKGKYTGRVSIVFTREDANNFKQGDVLVASSTTPDFIHAIKKAGAMVADEGGIISHAAITSRELKIPCIIGTKIATQVLKDGDLVEVDADTGVVRILERHV
jgi:phosphohistidine swiveling domain-containing protein